MKIRKYFADNTYNAFKQIRAELGEDAMILHSQKVRQGGWLGFLKGSTYEITVAVDDEEPVVASADAAKSSFSAGMVYQSDRALQTSELEDIRAAIKQMQETVNRLSSGNGKNFTRRSTQLVRLRDLLTSQGLDGQMVQEVIKQVDFELSRAALRDWTIVCEAAARQLEQRFDTVDFTQANSVPTVIFVVGPTGAGKTTTIAKMAAMLASGKTRSVSVLTVDTVRIGAIPQLQAYADILDVPFQVVYSASEMAQSVKHSATDVVLIDTPGCSPRGTAKQKLPEFVSAVGPCTVLLAISSTTREDNALKAIEDLNGVPLHGLIVTKLDETSRYGHTFNLVYRSGLPIAFVTTGQNVPDDIEPADAKRMVARLFGAKS